MALEHACSGEPVDLHPVGEALTEVTTTALVKTDAFEAIRLVIPKGHKFPTHQVKGSLTFQCLEGRVAFTAEGKTQELVAGQWLFLNGQEPHSLVGLENSSALLTIML